MKDNNGKRRILQDNLLGIKLVDLYKKGGGKWTKK
jgi:hypothetical protein